MGMGGEVTVNGLPDHLNEPHYRCAVINQHRLWAEDFIGDYQQRAGRNLP